MKIPTDKRRIGIGLAALALLVLFVWLVRGDAPTAAQSSPTVDRSPLSEASQRSEPTILSPSQSEERVPIVTPTEVVAAKATASGLIRVTVLEKGTEKPLRGAVVSSTHEPADGIFHRVSEVQGTRGTPFQYIKTGADGRVEIEMPLGIEARVSASGREIEAGFADAVVPALGAGEVREVVLRLPTENDLPFWMQLVEEATRAPIPWASVTMSRTSKPAASLTTDAKGFVFCAASTWMITTIRVAPERYAAFYLEPEPGHATVETALVVTVPAAATLRVEVTDAAGRAVRDAKVVLATEGYHLSRSQKLTASLRVSDPSWSEKTDENGVATLTALPVRVPLRASLASPKQWNAAEPLVLAPGETRDVAWQLSSGCTLRGVVIDQHQKPVADRSIWLRPAVENRTGIFNDYSSGPTRTAKTNVEGRFQFDDVDAGGWSVGPSAWKVTERPAADDVVALAHFVSIAADQKDVEVTIRVDRGLFIRGRVLDPDGKPPQWGAVQANDLVKGLHTSAQLEQSTGNFAVGPLMAGRHVLQADAGKHAPSDPVEVDAGTEGVELRLNPGGSIAGRVIGQDGSTVEAKVIVAPRNSQTVRSFWLDTQRGSFKIEGVERATFDLAASTTDGRAGVLEGVELGARESKTELTITVAPGGRVRVRHDGPDVYVGVRILQRDIVYGGDGVQRGVSREFVAPAGRVTVRATYPDDEHRAVERIVDVKAGETVDVTFEKGAR